MSNNKGRIVLNKEDEAKWRTRHEELGVSRPVAGLFRGWMPDSFPKARCRVLYIGKATSGDFDGQEPEQAAFNGSGDWKLLGPSKLR